MQEKKRVEEESRVYERDRDLIYISGFERYLEEQQIKEFLEKFGEVSHFEYFSGRSEATG